MGMLPAWPVARESAFCLATMCSASVLPAAACTHVSCVQHARPEAQRAHPVVEPDEERASVERFAAVWGLTKQGPSPPPPAAAPTFKLQHWHRPGAAERRERGRAR